MMRWPLKPFGFTSGSSTVDLQILLGDADNSTSQGSGGDSRSNASGISRGGSSSNLSRGQGTGQGEEDRKDDDLVLVSSEHGHLGDVHRIHSSSHSSSSSSNVNSSGSNGNRSSVFSFFSDRSMSDSGNAQSLLWKEAKLVGPHSAPAAKSTAAAGDGGGGGGHGEGDESLKPLLQNGSNSLGSPSRRSSPSHKLMKAPSPLSLQTSQKAPASAAAAAAPGQESAAGLASACLYGVVGLAMGFINKAVLIEWPYSNSFLMFQMGASLLILHFLSLFSLVQLRPLELSAVRSLWAVVFFYNANVAFALAAVRALSIPVYHVLKRLTPVMILAAKWGMGEPPPPPQLLLAVCTVVAGCFLAGAGDLGFDLQGYLWAVGSCFLQTVYLILVEKSGTEKSYSSNELLVYNSLLSLPVLMLLTFVTGEIQHALPDLVALVYRSPDFVLVFILSLAVGVLLNYALFLCTRLNSALTTSIVGALRSVLGTFLGFFVLGGVKATPLIVLGTITNTVGGLWYTVIKFGLKHFDYGKTKQVSNA